MDKLSREELLLVREKFPDSLISKFYDEYFPNDELKVPKEINNELIQNGKDNHLNNLCSLANEKKIRESGYSNIALDNLSREEILLVQEKLSNGFIQKLYDDYFQNDVLTGAKEVNDELMPKYGIENLITLGTNRKNPCELNTSNTPTQRPTFQQASFNNRARFSPANNFQEHINDGLLCYQNMHKPILLPDSSNYQYYSNNIFSQSRNLKTRNILCFKSKKSVKMTVPSNKRQILEEEFRKEKYPSNDKLQKMSIKLSMRYDEVQNYFKKRRREEKETNHKFSNLVKLLDNYLEQED